MIFSLLRRSILRTVGRLLLELNVQLICLARRLLPPRLTLLEQIGGLTTTQLIHAAAYFRIADLLDFKPKTAEELAKTLHTNPDATFRMMRALASLGVFKLRRDGKYSNNRISRTLISHHKENLRDFAIYFGSPSNSLAWSDFIETVRTGKNAFQRVHQASIWEWFHSHPLEGEKFSNAMTNLTQIDASFLARAYPFQEIQILCDIAGGRGTLLTEILKVHSHLKAILFDYPNVLRQAETDFCSVGLNSRVESKAGDFFKEVPGGCDAYLLKDILHDWDDENCLNILRNVRTALCSGGRLLVVEVLIKPYQTRPPAPLMDVHMMTVCCEGRQRSREELLILFRKSGFRMGRLFSTVSPYSVIEAIADPS